MIDPYEKIIKVMRDQGRTESPLFCGVLRADGKLSVGDLLLEQGDYSRVGNITTNTPVKVLIAYVEDDFIILGKVVD